MNANTPSAGLILTPRYSMLAQSVATGSVSVYYMVQFAKAYISPSSLELKYRTEEAADSACAQPNKLASNLQAVTSGSLPL